MLDLYPKSELHTKSSKLLVAKIKMRILLTTHSASYRSIYISKIFFFTYFLQFSSPPHLTLQWCKTNPSTMQISATIQINKGGKPTWLLVLPLLLSSSWENSKIKHQVTRSKERRNRSERNHECSYWGTSWNRSIQNPEVQVQLRTNFWEQSVQKDQNKWTK